MWSGSHGRQLSVRSAHARRAHVQHNWATPLVCSHACRYAYAWHPPPASASAALRSDVQAQPLPDVRLIKPSAAADLVPKHAKKGASQERAQRSA